MADENNALLLKDKKRVYLFNTQSTVHEYVGGLIVDKDDPLMPGQTEVVPTANADHQYWNGSAWVSEVVITYEIKADQSLGLIARHPQGYTLQANETFTKPADGLYEPKWNGSTWVGISAEEYFKQHPVAPAKPTAQQTAMTALGQQVGDLIAENQSLKAQLQKSAQATQALGELVAPLIAKENTTTQGGN